MCLKPFSRSHWSRKWATRVTEVSLPWTACGLLSSELVLKSPWDGLHMCGFVSCSPVRAVGTWSTWTCHGVIRSRRMASRPWCGVVAAWEPCCWGAARRYRESSRSGLSNVYLMLGVRTWLWNLCPTVPSPGSISFLFSPFTQLEDEALKHIQNYCHELVSLNLQSCSVSNMPFTWAPSCSCSLRQEPAGALLGSSPGRWEDCHTLMSHPVSLCDLPVSHRMEEQQSKQKGQYKAMGTSPKNSIDQGLGLF